MKIVASDLLMAERRYLQSCIAKAGEMITSLWDARVGPEMEATTKIELLPCDFAARKRIRESCKDFSTVLRDCDGKPSEV
jgi:hypothetical protein